MAESAGLARGYRRGGRVAGEVLDGTPVVVEQEVGHVPAEVVTHQDALDREVLTVGREV